MNALPFWEIISRARALLTDEGINDSEVFLQGYQAVYYLDMAQELLSSRAELLDGSDILTSAATVGEYLLFSTVATVKVYRPLRVFFNDAAGKKVQLTFKSVLQLDTESPGWWNQDPTDPPSIWTMRGINLLQLVPAPSVGSRTITVWGKVSPAAYSSGATDRPQLPIPFHMALVFGTAWLACEADRTSPDAQKAAVKFERLFTQAIAHAMSIALPGQVGDRVIDIRDGYETASGWRA